MEWVLVIVAGIVGFLLGAKGGAGSVQTNLDRVLTAQAHDRMNFLTTLRRELANYLIWHDADRYLRLYQLIHAEMSSFKDLTPANRRTRLAELCKTYPQFEDFDLIATRDYVLYAETLGRFDLADIEQRYRDIMAFQALTIASDHNWSYFHTTSQDELNHLSKFVQSVKDTRLRQRLEQAVRERYIWEIGKDAPEREEIDWPDMVVRRVDHFAENRLGIHLKKTNEFGLYGVFYGDDNKSYKSYYRTDPSFQEEVHLDLLHGVLQDSNAE